MKRGTGEAEAALLAAVEHLLQTHLPQKITTTMVLRAAGVARGTLYRHFRDLDELIEKALVAAFCRSVELNIDLIAAMIDSAASATEFHHGAAKINFLSQAREQRAFRFLRARLIAYSEGNPRLAGMLSLEQNRLTGRFEKLMQRLMDRGWMRRDLDPRVVAVFIQAYTLGKVIDDLTTEPMSDSGWNSLILEVLEKVIFTPLAEVPHAHHAG